MRRRKKRFRTSAANNILDGLSAGVSGLFDHAVFGSKQTGATSPAPRPEDKYRNWISHPPWDPEFLFDIFFLILFFPWFLWEMYQKRRHRALERRKLRHTHRIARYRAAAGAANRRRRGK